MVYWGNNVKFLRKHWQLSQDVMAQELNISRSKLNAHENGYTINPTAGDLLSFSKYFTVSIDHLLKTDLSSLNEQELKKIVNDTYIAGANLRVLSISLGADNKENIEYVPVKAKAGYNAGYSDPEYIAGLPKYSFPDLPNGKTYRMFPTVGNSMLPIPEGSDILASYITDWSYIKPDTGCIVIFKNNNDFVFKNITLIDGGNILLKSTNRQYNPYKEHLSNVLEIWQFERLISRTVPDAPTEIDELKSMLIEMRQQLASVK